MLIRSILVAGAMVAVSASAFAQSTHAVARPSMKLDTMQQGAGKLGSHMGSNKDVHEPTPGKSWPSFSKADTNGDGQIEWREAKAEHVKKRFFKKEDYEHNGKLDRTEWMLVGFDQHNANSKKASKKG